MSSETLVYADMENESWSWFLERLFSRRAAPGNFKPRKGKP